MFYNPKKAQGTTIVDELRASSVLQPIGDTPFFSIASHRGDTPPAGSLEGRHALNFVSTMHMPLASSAVVLPFLLSLIIAAAWPAVATGKFGADVQTSVQTGFSVASYVVTAGALLVALVTFMSTVSQASVQMPANTRPTAAEIRRAMKGKMPPIQEE